jgi:ATP-dependent DNA helicase RecQ
MDDLVAVLGPNIEILRGGCTVTHLLCRYTLAQSGRAHGMDCRTAQFTSGRGIIYALTIRDANQVAEWLKSQGLIVEAYSGKRATVVKLSSKHCWPTVSADCHNGAGMSFDKPDLSFVIHYQTPVPLSRTTASGASRSSGQAHMASCSAAMRSWKSPTISSSAFPTRDEVDASSAHWAESGGLSVPELLARINVSKGRIRKQ